MAVWPRRLIKALGTVFVLAFWAWNFHTSQRELKQARAEFSALLARKAILEERARLLRREVHALKFEKESRSRVARELLGVAGPRELVVIVPGLQETKR